MSQKPELLGGPTVVCALLRRPECGALLERAQRSAGLELALGSAAHMSGHNPL